MPTSLGEERGSEDSIPCRKPQEKLDSERDLKLPEESYCGVVNVVVSQEGISASDRELTGLGPAPRRRVVDVVREQERAGQSGEVLELDML